MVFEIRIGSDSEWIIRIGSDSDFKIYQLSDWELPIRSDAHLYFVMFLAIFYFVGVCSVVGVW